MKWQAYAPEIPLYASHSDFIRKAHELRLAEWRAKAAAHA